MAPHSTRAIAPASESTDNRTARDILEEYGKKIQQEANKDAKARSKGNLKGYLEKATYLHDEKAIGTTPENPCHLDHEYHTNVSVGYGKDNPCGSITTVRFSDVIGGQCTNSKIKGNEEKNGKDIGACAPFRRLFLCDQNLSHMDENKINNTHNLLLEVSLAANYEGKLLVEKYKKYKQKNKDFDSNICTALARSFADIGDIVRGKDLFLGYNQKDRKEKEQLQNKLKNIFKNIYEGLKYPQDNDYNDPKKNYFKLREDWWDANRKEVWRAITCKAPKNDRYSANIEYNNLVFSNDQCGHMDEHVPTYLDYVPQYLRWFDEWGEEFCRKKKKYVNIVKSYCRDEAKAKYCSLNGHDCTKTIRKTGDLQLGNGCTECLYACTYYREWLAKQKKEFDKQKEKYTKEITKRNEQKKDINNTANNEYDTKFYEELKSHYGNVGTFLELLNKQKECKAITTVEGNINFAQDNYKETFYRSEYCEMCPECGVVCNGNKCTPRDENDERCKKATDKYDRRTDEKATTINVLYSGDEDKHIAQKLQKFCEKLEDKNGTQNQEWECYYRGEYNNNCKMTDPVKKDKEPPKVMSFDGFFEYWVTHLIKDTIKWESDLKNCINHTNVTNCKSDCNKNCVCFDQWVKKKQIEWDSVKEVFKNQSGISEKYYKRLNGFFKGFFFHVMHKHKEEKEIEEEAQEEEKAEEAQKEERKWNQLTAKLEEIIESHKQNTHTGKSPNEIELLFDYLEETAKTCIDNNANESCDHPKDPKSNPCIKNPSGSKKLVSVKQIAELKQRNAREQLEEGGVGETKLKGDASKGEYKQGGGAEGFKNVCSITDIHSNRNQEFSGGPCDGKDSKRRRFKIGTEWKIGEKVETTDIDAYIPPRRRHMCTSNLEFLETGDGPLNSSNGKLVNNSFLGDVMLSAKSEAEKTRQYFADKNADHGAACRAIKYSFADIGDIIRGTDMWHHKDQNNVQVYLKNVFEKIKKHHPGIQGKYNDDEDKKPPYKKLREDWWEANRHQVWRAMKCAIQDGKIDNCNGIPIEDYIPQRLRWMTEWAEWYCKKQSQEYDKLELECEGCMGDDKGATCTKRPEEYKKCKKASKKYEGKIEPWKEQWEKLQKLYELLYHEARVNVAGNGGIDTSNTIKDDEDKPVIEFLFELYKKNGGKLGPFPTTNTTYSERATTDTNTPYNNAGAYVHDTGVLNDCKEQTRFCDDTYYAFKNTPYKYNEVLLSKIRKMLKELGDATIDDEESPSPLQPPEQPPLDEEDSDEEDSEDEDEEEIHKNPCGGSSSGSEVTKTVKQIARQMHETAKNQLDKSGSRGSSVLKADAKLGHYTRGGTGNDFKYLCSITKIDSNDGRRGGEPCTGKDGHHVRFKIGKDWTHLQNSKTSYSNVYLPPRREHMCTSNLENLHVDSVIKNGNAIHSLLGDVQLAAKMDAAEIIKRYKNQNGLSGKSDSIDAKHKDSICRAIRYSFADLGDVIRGRDMWDKDRGSTDMEDRLKKIFKNIYEKYDGIKDNRKYTDTENFLDLRSDWWEANRRQVWKAMQCSLQDLKTSHGDCHYNIRGTPLDDYIPQRLRWMTEWSEWFCKMQKEAYNKLLAGCTSCMSYGKGGDECYRETKECNDCKAACEQYKKEIKSWEEQWKQMEQKYQMLYLQAENGASGDIKDQQVVVFLKELHKENSGKTTYNTAAGYIHQELPEMGCKVQDIFCSSSGGKENSSYIFKQPPHDYEKACACQNRKPPEPCEIVAKVFKDEDKFTEACKHKYSKGKEKYTQWRCINDNPSTHSPPHAAPSTSLASPGQHSLPANSANSVTSATCIPPRRQQMYIPSLSGTESPVELRTKFIEMAAIETFFQWHKFKMEKEKKKKPQVQIGGVPLPFFNYDDDDDKLHEEVPQVQLNGGEIPEDFLREMFYTLGDYRDILFGKDISSVKNMNVIKTNIETVLKNSDPKPSSGNLNNKRENWWKQYGKDIWDGMICALGYNTQNRNKDDKVHKLLMDAIKYNEKYNYNSVKINSIPISADKTDTSLLQFASRPTFFRWLEEWGHDFCRKRTDKLARVNKKCRGKYEDKHCSADGHDCADGERRYNNIFADLDCSDCHEKCTDYKKWIEKKLEEFYKQKSKYPNEHKKLKTSSNSHDDEKFYKEVIEKNDYSSVEKFLESLNHCKPDKINDDKNNKLNFNNPQETFSPSTYCKACPLYGVNCRNKSGNCTPIKENVFTRQNNLDTIKIIDTSPTSIDIEMIDHRGQYIKEDVKNLFKESHLFKSVRDQNWICKFIHNKLDECTLHDFNPKIDTDESITFKVLIERWLQDFLEGYKQSKKKIELCTKNEKNECIEACKDKCVCLRKWLTQKEKEWNEIKRHFHKRERDDRFNMAFKVQNYFQKNESVLKKLIDNYEDLKNKDEYEDCIDDGTCELNNKGIKKDMLSILLSELQKKIHTSNTESGEPQPNCEKSSSPDDEEDDPYDDSTDTPTNTKPQFCPTEEEVVPKKEEESDSDMLCDGNKQTNCENLKTLFSNSKYEPKNKLIGLEARNLIAGIKSNVYISPRVQQLCLEPLKELVKTKGDSPDKSKLIKAFTECAYNEGRGLYEYYKKNKNELVKKGSTLSDKDVDAYTLEAMKRSYADYGNIVKDDMLWNYDNSYDVNEIIFDIATQYSKTQNTHSSDYETKQRQNLWESIRTHVWKAMVCGYKDAVGGDITSLPNGADLCTLPSTDKDDQFLRWFEEWGQNFCIRREQEIKRLNEKCHNGICNSTNEGEKQECKILCDNYKQFLSSSQSQYDKQSILYNELKESNSEFKHKDALTFLKEQCNSKCLCFKDIKNTNKINNIIEYFSDKIKDQCECKKEIAPDDPFKDLNECPDKKNKYCDKYSTVPCNRKNKEYLLDNWDTMDLLHRTTLNKGVLVPPRRSHICFPNKSGIKPRIKNKIQFKEHILNAAGAEAKYLSDKYRNDENSLLVAMKYSFADIGNIIKGDDMLDDIRSIKIKDIIKRVNRNITEDSKKLDGEKWWEENRDHVWNVMACHYKKNSINNNICPSHNDIDKENQFLRWLVEWGRQVCKEKKELKASVYKKCKDKDRKEDEICNYAASFYNNWNKMVKHEYDGLNTKYKNFKSSTSGSTLTQENAAEYIKEKCSECQCSFEDIEETLKKNSEPNDEVLDVIINKSHIPPHLEDIFNRYNGPYLRCPDSNLCRPYKNIRCIGKIHNDDGDWESTFVKDNKTTNIGVLLPPRRRQLCLRIYAEQIDHLRKKIQNFKNFICSCAFAEAKRLKDVYEDDRRLLQAMKYSFSDIGSVVKGDDMMESTASDNITKIFNGSKYSGTDRKTWWDLNKYHVWESMLCGYKEAKGDTSNNQNCRFPDIETVPQFLRWFQEWTEIFCNKRNKLYEEVISQCSTAICNKQDGSVAKIECTEACEIYKNYVLKKKTEYEIQKKKYDTEFQNKNGNEKDAPNYFKDKCKNNCECLFKIFNDSKKWQNPYESITDKALKGKCDCKKIEPPPLPPKPDDILPTPADEPFNRDILEKTIPFGVALALGSIAFLFLKKKTQAPVDLFSVINIPKGDYDIPTLKSSNRYIPYASDRYKGKTYIYMEGDSSGDEKYAFMSDTTDVTSSESEYEELDINDIYVPGSPKYKTLIEVVLEPSKRDIQSDDIPSSDTPMNKFTDEEWNQLKHDFISNMLQNQPNDVPNDYKSENVPLNTQPNTLYFNKPEEKPFITSIHDRNLYSGEEHSYNVNMVNNDNIPLSGKNAVYSGIDLINDSLNSNNVDIYDELLKRKENELFGTNHPKHTSTHNVTKSSNSDPIDNQLNLFHTWLDRHRDMCEQWNNKKEVLDKLKEEWNKDNNSGDIPSDSNKTLNTDVSIQIHMDNPIPTNEFTNMDSILEDLEKYNEPYYDVQDDIYCDVNDHDVSTVDSNPMDVPSKVQIEMDVNTKLVKEKYPIADVWDI
ncbi:erythrocyte membrane protein 1, PfEMP1, putative [Plasmodium sp.]|nr:erythrocyte membrane protein 1, PfEMP1, putative [Plasmodium sp.]